jgi:hypothetical protein
LRISLFYDNYKSGVLYREFASLEDIRQTEAAFDQVVAIDDLLALMNIKLDSPSGYGFLTFKNLLLTLWARHSRRLKGEKLKALTLSFSPSLKNCCRAGLIPIPTRPEKSLWK